MTSRGCCTSEQEATGDCGGGGGGGVYTGEPEELGVLQ